MYLNKIAKNKLKKDSQNLCLAIAELLLFGWNNDLAKTIFSITYQCSNIRINPNDTKLDYNFINNNLFYYGTDLAEITKLFEKQEKSTFNRDMLTSKFIAIKKLIIKAIAHEKILLYCDFIKELRSII